MARRDEARPLHRELVAAAGIDTFDNKLSCIVADRNKGWRRSSSVLNRRRSGEPDCRARHRISGYADNATLDPRLLSGLRINKRSERKCKNRESHGSFSSAALILAVGTIFNCAEDCPPSATSSFTASPVMSFRKSRACASPVSMSSQAAA